MAWHAMAGFYSFACVVRLFKRSRGHLFTFVSRLQLYLQLFWSIYSLRHAAGHQLEPALAGNLMIQYPAQSYLLVHWRCTFGWVSLLMFISRLFDHEMEQIRIRGCLFWSSDPNRHVSVESPKRNQAKPTQAMRTKTIHKTWPWKRFFFQTTWPCACFPFQIFFSTIYEGLRHAPDILFHTQKASKRPKNF